MFIDTHAHLTALEISAQREEMLQRARLHRIGKIVNICTDEKTLEAGLALADITPEIYNTAATTPHDVDVEGERFFPVVEQAARGKKLIALGETGLDYYYEHAPRKAQQTFLLRYFALAHSTELPLIFHCREAFDDLFALSDVHFAQRPALLHCFTGTLD